MDHKQAYAHHVAQAIRHKKAMKETGGELGNAEDLDLSSEDDAELPALGDDDPPLDAKAARKERLKAILAR